MHEKVHDAGEESRCDVRISRGLRLRSLRLGLVGMADVVEFHRNGDLAPDSAGAWQPFPVEYKRGKPKENNCDRVQLCAQALCLEEMLNCVIPAGALFYGTTRRRQDVAFDAGLREKTENAARLLHALFDSGITPPAVYEKKCESCSMSNVCMPKSTGQGKSARKYLQTVMRAL